VWGSTILLNSARKTISKFIKKKDVQIHQEKTSPTTPHPQQQLHPQQQPHNNNTPTVLRNGALQQVRHPRLDSHGHHSERSSPPPPPLKQWHSQQRITLSLFSRIPAEIVSLLRLMVGRGARELWWPPPHSFQTLIFKNE